MALLLIKPDLLFLNSCYGQGLQYATNDTKGTKDFLYLHFFIVYNPENY